MKKMIKATLIYPLRNGMVYLGLKQKKVAAGLRSGYGGKRHPEDKSMVDTACREIDEENNYGINYQRENLDLRAVIDFTLEYSDKPSFAMRVFTYVLDGFEGDLGGTHEINDPKPYSLDEIPYSEMLPDNGLFLGRILGGDYLFGELVSIDDEVVKNTIKATTAENLRENFPED